MIRELHLIRSLLFVRALQFPGKTGLLYHAQGIINALSRLQSGNRMRKWNLPL